MLSLIKSWQVATSIRVLHKAVKWAASFNKPLNPTRSQARAIKTVSDELDTFLRFSYKSCAFLSPRIQCHFQWQTGLDAGLLVHDLPCGLSLYHEQMPFVGHSPSLSSPIHRCLDLYLLPSCLSQIPLTPSLNHKHLPQSTIFYHESEPSSKLPTTKPNQSTKLYGHHTKYQDNFESATFFPNTASVLMHCGKSGYF